MKNYEKNEDQASLALINRSGVTLIISAQPTRIKENTAGCQTIVRS